MAKTVEVVVGTIGKPHGLKGEVAIDLRTDEPTRRFADGAALFDERSRRPLTVTSSRWVGGRLLVRFAELADRSAVEAARGTVLATEVAAEEAPEGFDEYYDRQLVGLRVLGSDGRQVGVITEVAHLPAQDLLTVHTDAGDKLVPLVQALVPTIDVAGGFVQLAEVPGLLDDQAVSDGTDGSGKPTDG